MKPWARSPQRERAGLAGAADDAPGGAREADEVLALAAARARPELRREARGVQQLQAELQRGGAPGRRRSRRSPGARAPSIAAASRAELPDRASGASSRLSRRQSRLKTAGCGSGVSNSRPTASQARAAASSARASSRSRG